jgi:hypothetical protein
MATIRLDKDYDCEMDDQPPVCMVCGDTAFEEDEVMATKSLVCTPPWMYALLILICCSWPGWLVLITLAIVLRKKATVATPLCLRHGNYWLHGTLAGIGCVSGMMTCLSLLVYLLWDTGGVNPPPGWAFAILGLVMFGLLVFAAVFQRRRIRATLIDEYDITLTNVHPDYKAAMNELREQRAEQRRLRKARKRREREEREQNRPEEPREERRDAEPG